MTLRPYNSNNDGKDLFRVIRECGWPDPEKNKALQEAWKNFAESGNADVAEWKGHVEASITSHRGSIRMMDRELPLCAVTSVCVGHILRRTGTASKLTARLLAREASECSVAALGMFDQGFYDKLGFGAFPYTYTVSVDPNTLMVPSLKRRPVRLSHADIDRMLKNILKRRINHGQVQISLREFFMLSLHEIEDGFGIGFENDDGEITHHMWMAAKSENGPYNVYWMIYEDYDGLMELLSFMKSLSDQVNCFKFTEPYGMQIQDLLLRPFRTREISAEGKYRNEITAESWQQARILNMEKTFAVIRIPHGQIDFNLDLNDPIESSLPEDSEWRGLGGQWTIRIGEQVSTATQGHQNNLPLLRASVNALTRLVFGVQMASSLSVLDDFSAPNDLIESLDESLRLPNPNMDLSF